MLGASEGGPFGIEVVAPGYGATGRFRMTERASVRRADGTAVTAGSGEAGLVAIRPPIPLGYLDDPEGTARTFPTFDGTRWAVPGDWVIPEADGTLTLLGRGSGCIVTGGEKVFPEEVEGVLEALEEIADVVVAGAPDDRFGQRVIALVAPSRAAGGLTPEGLLERVRALASVRLAGYKLPREVIVVPAVRRQPPGKPDRAWAAAIATRGARGELSIGAAQARSRGLDAAPGLSLTERSTSSRDPGSRSTGR
jgi:acyl-CoA synthetase (AMP-forming)/AMP-acid ligase II